MDHHAQGEKYRSLFVTNNFHVFRASIYAKKAKLDAEGIGSKTAFYYVPNAFTREFIGLLDMYKWAHITVFNHYAIRWLIIESICVTKFQLSSI